MMAFRISILLFVFLIISASAIVADTVTTVDTTYQFDTVYVYDTSIAVQKQLIEIKSDFYNQACASFDSRQTTITIMLGIIGGFLAIIAIMIAAFTIYLIVTAKRNRKEFEEEKEKIKELRVKAEEDTKFIGSLKAELLEDSKEVNEKSSKNVTEAKEKAKEKEIVIPDKIIELINEADAQQSIDEYESLLFKMQLAGIDKNSLPSKLIKNVSLNYMRLQKYKKALENINIYLESNPKDNEMLFNAGLCNGSLYNDDKDIENLNNAIKMWRKAAGINPKDDWSYYNWGVSLSILYDERGDISLLEDAIEKIRKAIEINPKNDTNYVGWGAVLAKLYDRLKDISLLEDAIKKFDLAIEINPRNDAAYINWSAALLQMYHIDNDVKHLNEAKEKNNKALQLKSKDKSLYYNIACTESLLGKKQAMLNALRIAIDYDSNYKKMAREDKDFKKYWDDPDFKELTKED